MRGAGPGAGGRDLELVQVEGDRAGWGRELLQDLDEVERVADVGADHRLLIDVLRRRALNQNAVDRGIRVQTLHYGDQLLL